MKAWHDLLRRVRNTGTLRPDRTGVGTVSLFAETIKVPNDVNSFPAVTTKSLAFKVCAAEMACFIRGARNLSDFRKAGCHVWDGNGTDPAWESKQRSPGDLGRIYGVQWRNWLSVDFDRPASAVGGHIKSTDQLVELLEGLHTDPNGRRHVVTAWNPGELEEMCLPPCPIMFQVLRAGNRIDMVVYQRSCDLFLGLPFDLAGYALLQRLIASELGVTTGELTFFIGDAHIYLNHFEQVDQVLAKQPYKAPTLELAPDAGLFNLQPSMVRLLDYIHHPAVKAPLNV